MPNTISVDMGRFATYGDIDDDTEYDESWLTPKGSKKKEKESGWGKREDENGRNDDNGWGGERDDNGWDDTSWGR